MKISYVIPCYRSEKTLGGVINEIKETMAGMSYEYEIVLVNDCSPDNTWGVIEELVSNNANITGINFAKNFGQHSALLAGIIETVGDYVICLDDDGQTPANEAGLLIEALNNGADAVYAKYDHKKHSAFRNFGTFMNEKMAEHMLGKPRNLFVSSYFGVKRFVADEMVKYTNAYPYVIGLVLRTTRNIVNVSVNHRNREIGSSGYTFSKLMNLWINGFTAFSVKPLRIATGCGAVFACIGFLYGIYTIIKRLIIPDLPMGYSALMSAVVFMGGMLMLMMGMVGEYIGRIYVSINNSPQYVIKEKKKGGQN
ncbi:MAG: glycosyltransferase family 2 protein [Lachnospiraceae bacterium]|nr:glycosyltransferase family 2 protein [Lachnospiraceae bacterium]